MWAAYHNNVPMVRLLLEHGADPNQATAYGSPLSQACWNDSVGAAKILIDHGAKVDGRDASADFTPLHWAAGSERLLPDLVKLLLSSGADPNAAGGEPVEAFEMIPQTPRLIAERRGHSAIVEALADAGAKEPPRPEKVVTPHRSLPEQLDDSTVIAAAEKALAALQDRASSRRRFSGTSASKTASRATSSTPMAPWATPATVHPLRPGGRQGTDRRGRHNKSRYDCREWVGPSIIRTPLTVLATSCLVWPPR